MGESLFRRRDEGPRRLDLLSQGCRKRYSSWSDHVSNIFLFSQPPFFSLRLTRDPRPCSSSTAQQSSNNPPESLTSNCKTPSTSSLPSLSPLQPTPSYPSTPPTSYTTSPLPTDLAVNSSRSLSPSQQSVVPSSLKRTRPSLGANDSEDRHLGVSFKPSLPSGSSGRMRRSNRRRTRTLRRTTDREGRSSAMGPVGGPSLVERR